MLKICAQWLIILNISSILIKKSLEKCSVILNKILINVSGHFCQTGRRDLQVMLIKLNKSRSISVCANSIANLLIKVQSFLLGVSHVDDTRDEINAQY